jgi:DNA-binding transcriptional regulator LsrR (DeoR family)
MQYDIKEVLRLRALGKTQRQISHKTHIAKSSVDRILKRSKELGIDWEFV